MIWAVLVILLILFFFIGGLIWMLLPARDTPAIESRVRRTLSHGERSTSRARPSRISLPAARVEPPQHAPNITDLLLNSEDAHRKCPSCLRVYGPQIAICPIDSTPLSVIIEPAHESTDERKQCPDCERIYARGAKYCYIDGSRLRSETASLRTFWGCTSCGIEGDGETGMCGCDAPSFVRIDLSDSGTSVPPLPVTRCGCCQKLYPHDMVTCPDDGEAVEPVWDLKLREHPPTGVGARRRVCHDCGTVYGRAASFCVRDGSKLSALN